MHVFFFYEQLHSISLAHKNLIIPGGSIQSFAVPEIIIIFCVVNVIMRHDVIVCIEHLLCVVAVHSPFLDVF